ncbi:acylglycerol kinase, mitochondrial isoform X2 [Patella vulgata]|uniref:acylglycerol kinase, mitochondrial isoform X2 n=1 Tax=Patella vulgata TaxID=6465 RepID=UPI00217FBF7D|nr:acylglycerol kinase, mitochondrial isoform X2 [Patella vulgata]
MAFIIKTAQTLRNHWKKSTAGLILSLYGIRYVKNRYEEDWIRRALCEEAKLYGDVALPPGSRPRRVTVFLNPAAQRGNGRKLFEKNAAPILYLAGMEVNVVKTEYDGQVKQFMGVLESKDTDGIIVAGGDGTFLETVTGCMRKEDKNYRNSVPIGIIPVGETNRFAQIVFGQDLNEVRFIGDAAMSVVKGVTKKYDVLKIEGSEGKITYAVSGLETGAYRDAESRKSKYWYFGPLKSRWTYLRTAMKSWPPSFKADISYVLSTEENTKQSKKVEQTPSSSYGWLGFLIGRTNRNNVPLVKEYDFDDSKDDEEMISEPISTVEFTVNSTNLDTDPKSVEGMTVGIGPSEPTKSQLIKEGWRRINDKSLKFGTEENRQLVVKKIKFTPEDTDMMINIDGESFEALPIEISLLKDRINVFYKAEAAS